MAWSGPEPVGSRIIYLGGTRCLVLPDCACEYTLTDLGDGVITVDAMSKGCVITDNGWDVEPPGELLWEGALPERRHPFPLPHYLLSPRTYGA